MFKVNNKNTRKTPLHHSDVLLLTLNIWYQWKIVWHSKKHWKYNTDIFSKDDDETLKFYHDLYTSTNDSSSLNFLNEPIWWMQVSMYVLSPNVSHH